MAIMLTTAAAAALRTLDRTSQQAVHCLTPADRELIRRCAEIIAEEQVPAPEIMPIRRLCSTITRRQIKQYLSWRRGHIDFCHAA